MHISSVRFSNSRKIIPPYNPTNDQIKKMMIQPTIAPLPIERNPSFTQPSAAIAAQKPAHETDDNDGTKENKPGKSDSHAGSED